MNSKNTRRALLGSVVAMLVCFTMLLSTTFAWFTDTAVSASNKIVAGTLKVDLEVLKDGSFVSIKESKAPIFNYEKWEPGYTEVKVLKIENEGTLALKWVAKFVSETALSELANVIDVYVLPSVAPLSVPADRNLDGYTKVGTVAEFVNTIETTTYGSLNPAGTTGDVAYLGIALKMREDAGNEYQGKDLGGAFDITILATQLNYESDSFDENYDKDAEYAVTAKTGDDLRTALDIGGNVVVEGDMNVTGTVDVPTWTNAPAEYVIDGTWVNSMTGGNYILDEASKYGIVARVSAGEVLELSDMTVTANSQWPMYLANFGGEIVVSDVTLTAESGAGVYPYGTAGTTTLENVKVNQERLDPAYQATTPWAATAVASSNGHNLVINSGVYVGSTKAVYSYNSGSTITINGGTFKAPIVIQLDGVWSGSNKSVAIINGGDFDGGIHLDWGTNVPELYINGGNFTNFSATVCGAAKLVITGGTFDADPSAWVATGYVATETNGVWTVVAE